MFSFLSWFPAMICLLPVELWLVLLAHGRVRQVDQPAALMIGLPSAAAVGLSGLFLTWIVLGVVALGVVGMDGVGDSEGFTTALMAVVVLSGVALPMAHGVAMAGTGAGLIRLTLLIRGTALDEREQYLESGT